MKFSELSKIEIQIGFLIGMIIGLCGSCLAIIGNGWPWYIKCFAMLAAICVIGMQFMALSQAWIARKNLVEALREAKKMLNGA